MTKKKKTREKIKDKRKKTDLKKKEKVQYKGKAFEGREPVPGKRSAYPSDKKTKPGIFLEGHYVANAKGYGFIENPEWEEDIFVPAEFTLNAMPGDLVRAELLKKDNGPRKRGRIVMVLERASHRIVGTFYKNKNFGFIVPDNPRLHEDFFVEKNHMGGAVTGDKVLADIIRYGDKKSHSTAGIREILGKENEAGVDILSVLKEADIPMDFPDKVLKMAERIPERISEADRSGRLDLRDVLMVTIDGPDARDLDDAVSLSVSDDRYHLGVHIADVSNYVQAGSALDREALKRGTSVYVPDRVVPMLPERLSNGICSLNAGEDRLTLSCLMDISKTGRIVDYRIAETVICVNERMSYPDVKEILEGNNGKLMERYREVIPMLRKMQELSVIIRKKREKRGAVDFDFPEPEFQMDDNGKVLNVTAHESNCATQLIEDFMLSANETVAKAYRRKKAPFVYRIHEKPNEEKLQTVADYVARQGIEVPTMEELMTPKGCRRLLRRVRKEPYSRLVSTELLRCMAKARYEDEPKGHFGLSARDYCHFTSPIRRYPDLQIHRIIKDDLRGRLDKTRKENYQEILPDVCEETSASEKRAADLERRCDKIKMAEYMEQHIGECFDGVISGVTGWGIYVELPNTVEGLVSVASLTDDFYDFSEDEHALIGRRSHRIFRLGENLRVRNKAVDHHLATIDFEIPDH